MNYSGCKGVVQVGAVPDRIVELTGFTIDQSANSLDASILDGTCTRRVKAGQLSWSGTIEAFYDPVDAGLTFLTVGSNVPAQFYPTGEETGEQYLFGSILITSVGLPVVTDGMITQSFAFDGDGVLTIEDTA